MSEDTLVMQCADCGAIPKTIKFRQDGEPALPSRWVRNEEGEPICNLCKMVVPARNYAYGARRPEGESDLLIDEQMRLAHRYRNDLCALEHERRKRANAILCLHGPELVETEAAIAEREEDLASVRAAIKQGNSRARQKNKGTPEQRERIKALGAELKPLRQRRKELREELFKAHPHARIDLDGIDAWANQEKKRLRAACGCYWGTYLHVEASASKFGKGRPPRFKRFDGSGHIAVQLQGGLSVADAMAGKDTQLQIELLPVVPGGGKRAQTKRRALCRLRVGSTDSGKPVWAEVGFLLHRPLPENGSIKWVHLTRERVATQDRWQLMFAVEGETRRDDRAESGRVGVDVGWRKLQDGSLRMAYWVGDDGASGELLLPPGDVKRWRKAEELASLRRLLFNAVVARLAEWLKTHAHPEWLAERTKTLHLWKSERQLAALVIQWRDNRFEGDAEIFGDWAAWQAVRQEQDNLAYHAVIKEAVEDGFLHAWQIQDRHLYEMQTGLRQGAERHRNDLQRVFAARLRRKYKTVIVEDVNWRDEVLKKAEAEKDDSLGIERLYHRMAAPGQLIRFLAETMAAIGKADPKNTTLTCHLCHRLCDFDAARELVHRCEHCGERWDIDENAACNLLASGEVMNQTPGTARGPQGDGSSGDETKERLPVQERGPGNRRRSQRTA